jgi:hypothetical protein
LSPVRLRPGPPFLPIQFQAVDSSCSISKYALKTVQCHKSVIVLCS